MKLFPAIDVYNNRAVRLLYGNRDMITDYGTPLENAVRWESQGAEYLHMVDLNGAFDDSVVNDKTLKEVVKNLNIPVQLGGGIKSFDKVKYYLDEVGVDRVIIGSACVTDCAMVEKACARYGDKIACGIDAKDGKVCIKGWVQSVDVGAVQLALQMKELGINTVIYTDITRDGALTGVNSAATSELQNKTAMNVIASGGMSRLEDITELGKLGIYGAILGRAIYTGNIVLSDAIKEANKYGF